MTNATQGPSPPFVSPSFAPQATLPSGEELFLTPTPTREPTPSPEPKEKAVAEEEEEQLTPKLANEDSQSAVEICDNTLDDDDDGMVDTEDTEDCPIAETLEEPAVAEEKEEPTTTNPTPTPTPTPTPIPTHEPNEKAVAEEEEEQEQKQPMTDSQKEGPSDESSTDSDIISEETKGTKGTTDEKKLEEQQPIEEQPVQTSDRQQLSPSQQL